MQKGPILVQFRGYCALRRKLLGLLLIVFIVTHYT